MLASTPADLVAVRVAVERGQRLEEGGQLLDRQEAERGQRGVERAGDVALAEDEPVPLGIVDGLRGDVQHGAVQRGQDVDGGEVAADVAGAGVVDQLGVLDPDLPGRLGDVRRSARPGWRCGSSRPKTGMVVCSVDSAVISRPSPAIEVSSTCWTSRCAARASCAACAAAQRVLVERVQRPVQRLEEPDRRLGRRRRCPPGTGTGRAARRPSQLFLRRVWKNSKVSTRCTEPTTMSSSQPRKLSLTSIANSRPCVDAQLRGVGRGLQPVQRVAEVQQDAEVVQADLLDGQQGAGRVREDDLVTRLARLVLDHELDLRVGADQLAQPVDGQLPDVVVVDLERVVPAVLAEPQLDVVAAQLLGQLGGLVAAARAPARGRPGRGW